MEKTEKKEIIVKIVATTSLPVDRLTATDYNAAARANCWRAVSDGARQKKREK